MQPYAVDMAAQLSEQGDQLVRWSDMPQPAPVDPRRVPFQVGDALGCGGVRGVQRHLDLREDAGRARGSGGRGDCREVATVDEGDVELCGGHPVGSAQDDELPLGRARHDRRALDGVGLSGEVDVVEPFAVEVAARGHGPDDRVVLPRVPQRPGHLHPVPGLQGPRVGVGDQVTAPGAGRLGALLLRHHPSGAAGGDVVQGRQLAGDVKGFGVRDRDDGRDPDGARGRREEGRPLHRADTAHRIR